jgi:hypothetical protein
LHNQLIRVIHNHIKGAPNGSDKEVSDAGNGRRQKSLKQGSVKRLRVSAGGRATTKLNRASFPDTAISGVTTCGKKRKKPPSEECLRPRGAHRREEEAAIWAAFPFYRSTTMEGNLRKNIHDKPT